MTEIVKAKFAASLMRSNSKIKADRATAIAEDAQIVFKRTVEDLEIEIKKKKRDRENMLDMSPENAMSLIVASDFDAREFVAKDITLGVEIRLLEIKLEIASKRYETLFMQEEGEVA